MRSRTGSGETTISSSEAGVRLAGGFELGGSVQVDDGRLPSEPASGCRGYATVSAGASIEISFDVNWEDLTPEQFIVGVHHQII